MGLGNLAYEVLYAAATGDLSKIRGEFDRLEFENIILKQKNEEIIERHKCETKKLSSEYEMKLAEVNGHKETI